MSRLYSNLKSAGGARFYFALDSSPGIISPGVATLTLFGRQLTVTEPASTVREPATAFLTLSGLSLSSPSLLTPAPVVLSLLGRQPTFETILVLQVPAPAPVEAAEQSYAPTLITQMTVTPDAAQILLIGRDLNASEGGNIGFVSPARALLSLEQLAPMLGIQVEVATLTIIGYAPTLDLNAVGLVEPETALLSINSLNHDLSVPFAWIDDDSVEEPVWLDDPRA